MMKARAWLVILLLVPVLAFVPNVSPSQGAEVVSQMVTVERVSVPKGRCVCVGPVENISYSYIGYEVVHEAVANENWIGLVLREGVVWRVSGVNCSAGYAPKYFDGFVKVIVSSEEALSNYYVDKYGVIWVKFSDEFKGDVAVEYRYYLNISVEGWVDKQDKQLLIGLPGRYNVAFRDVFILRHMAGGSLAGVNLTVGVRPLHSCPVRFRNVSVDGRYVNFSVFRDTVYFDVSLGCFETECRVYYDEVDAVSVDYTSVGEWKDGWASTALNVSNLTPKPVEVAVTVEDYLETFGVELHRDAYMMKTLVDGEEVYADAIIGEYVKFMPTVVPAYGSTCFEVRENLPPVFVQGSTNRIVSCSWDPDLGRYVFTVEGVVGAEGVFQVFCDGYRPTAVYVGNETLGKDRWLWSEDYNIIRISMPFTHEQEVVTIDVVRIAPVIPPAPTAPAQPTAPTPTAPTFPFDWRVLVVLAGAVGFLGYTMYEARFPRLYVEEDYRTERYIGRCRGEIDFTLMGKKFYGWNCGRYKVVLLHGHPREHAKQVYRGRWFALGLKYLIGKKVERIVVRGEPIRVFSEGDAKRVVKSGWGGLLERDEEKALASLLQGKEWRNVVWVRPSIKEEDYEAFLRNERSLVDIEEMYEQRLNKVFREMRNTITEFKTYVTTVVLRDMYEMIESMKSLVESVDVPLRLVAYMLDKSPQQLKDVADAYGLELGRRRLDKVIEEKLEEYENVVRMLDRWRKATEKLEKMAEGAESPLKRLEEGFKTAIKEVQSRIKRLEEGVKGGGGGE